LTAVVALAVDGVDMYRCIADVSVVVVV